MATSIVTQELHYFLLALEPLAEPSKFNDFLQRYDAYHKGETLCEFSPLGQFIFQGKVGGGLVECARKCYETNQVDVEAAGLASEVEAFGQTISALELCFFDSENGATVFDQYLVPLKQLVEELFAGQNPVFNQNKRKEMRFKMTDRHLAILQRVVDTYDNVWLGLSDFVMNNFHCRWKRAVGMVDCALRNNGELSGDSWPVSGMIELDWLELTVPPAVSQHLLLNAEDAQLPGLSRRRLHDFSKLLSGVGVQCKVFMKFSECDLASSVPRLRGHLSWDNPSQDVLGFAQTVTDFVQSFSQSEKHCRSGVVQAWKATLESDEVRFVTGALEVAISNLQKKCYDKIRCALDMFTQDKESEVPPVELPKPTRANAGLFNFVDRLLQTVRRSRSLKAKDSDDAWLDAGLQLFELKNNWPVKIWPGTPDFEVKEGWKQWGNDLCELSLHTDVLYTCLVGECHRVQEKVYSMAHTTMAGMQQTLSAAITEMPHLAKLLHDSENDFLERMQRNIQKGFAEIHQKLSATMDFVLKLRDFGFSFEDTDVDSLSLKAHAVRAGIQYFVSVYAAILFYRTPATWNPSCREFSQCKVNLEKALMSMADLEHTELLEQRCNHSVVRQMRKDMKMMAPAGSPGLWPGDHFSRSGSAAQRPLAPRACRRVRRVRRLRRRRRRSSWREYRHPLIQRFQGQ